MPKALLVANPISGKAGHGMVRARCVEAMAERGLAVQVIETTGPGQIARLIAEHKGADFDMLVAAGGDGTIREVADVASRLDVPLGILPLGTSNSVARELGIPTRPVEAAKVAATGTVRQVDMGETSGQRFLLCVGVGFDADVVANVHASRRGGINMMASYVPAIVKSGLTYAFPAIEVVIDGVAAPPGAVQVVVGNTRTWGGPFVLAPEARMDDGLLDISLFYGGRAALTAQALRAVLKQPMAKRKDKGSGALHYQAKEVFIPGPPSASVEIDGDPGPPLPLAIKVLPKVLKVVTPEEKPARSTSKAKR